MQSGTRRLFIHERGDGHPPQTVKDLLETIQRDLFERASQNRRENTHQAHGFDEMANILEHKRGLVKMGWCGERACEARVKESCLATIRVILDPKDTGCHWLCGVCGREAAHTVLFAKSY